MTNWIEKLTGSLEQKKQYREYRARVTRLPGAYRTAAEAMDRYLMRASGIADGETMVRMLTDLVDLFAEHAAAGTPIRDIVGADPIEFAEDFIASYAAGSWLSKERSRLTDAIARAEEES